MLSTPVFGTEGRMAGMENPWGLIEDESDFLSHPAAITREKGVRYYGHFGSVYNEVLRDRVDDNGYDGHGPDDMETNASLGAAFPVGPGRMGVFVDYRGNPFSRGTRDWHPVEDDWSGSLKSRHEAATMRFLYARPLTDRVTLGAEFDLAYRHEKTDYHYLNFHDSDPEKYWYRDITDIRYWEPTLKGSVEAMIGSSRLTTSVWGGLILAGDHDVDGKNKFTNGLSWLFDRSGDITGYRTGFASWLRVPLNTTLTLPLLMRFEYKKTTYDARGYGSFTGYNTLFTRDTG